MSGISISIYFLIPFIWGIASVFAYIVSFQITVELEGSTHFLLVHYLSGFLIFSFSYGIGYILLKFILKPTEDLLTRLKQSVDEVGHEQKAQGSAIEEADLSTSRQGRGFFSDELDEYRKVFGKLALGADIDGLQKQFPEIIFQSREMAFVLEQVLKVAPSPASVLILGQSGTGKELIADAVHNNSPRKDKSMVKINCGAISPGLLESEMFGHEKGAFTGAVGVHQGCFERADNSTLFLDEVGEMPMAVQVKLLRVLQNGEFQRVGGQKTFKVDVRIIAATNKDLKSLVDQAEFREDLFYRLNVFNINLPPLIKRDNDIDLLAKYFARKNNKQLSENTVSFLKEHDWKGNIRELENKIEKAAICSETQFLNKADFDLEIGRYPSSSSTDSGRFVDIDKTIQKLQNSKDFDLNEELGRMEVALITNALKSNNGIQARAAEMLGIKPRSLWNRIKKYSIDVSEFK